MEQYSSLKVDRNGAITLHPELVAKLSIEEGDEVALKVLDRIIVMRFAEACGCEYESAFGKAGTIILPKEIRRIFNWAMGSEIVVYYTDSLFILKAA